MPDHTLPIDIAELRRLHEAADLGELSYQEESDAYTHIVRRNGFGFVVQFPQDTTGRAEARARLFASLTQLPALLDRIEALEAALVAAEEADSADQEYADMLDRAASEGWFNDPTGSCHIGDAGRLAQAARDRANELRRAALPAAPTTGGE